MSEEPLAPPDGPAAVDSPPSDPAPKRRRGRPPGSKNKASSSTATGTGEPSQREIQAALEELLQLPGMLIRVRYDCDICVAHIRMAGPALAAKIAEDAETNPPLKKLLIRAHRAIKGGGLAMAVVGYVSVPLLHHAAPEQLAGRLGPLFGLEVDHDGHDQADEHNAFMQGGNGPAFPAGSMFTEPPAA